MNEMESPPTNESNESNDRTRNIGIQWEQVLEYVTQWPFTPYREYVRDNISLRFVRYLRSTTIRLRV